MPLSTGYTHDKEDKENRKSCATSLPGRIPICTGRVLLDFDGITYTHCSKLGVSDSDQIRLGTIAKDRNLRVHSLIFVLSYERVGHCVY
jgi:hypothetical protein